MTSQRTANHWLGTAKMGTDDGRQNGGTAVVDTNTKVYGTDNIFVLDASVFPGMVTTNPSAYIVIAAEKAAEKILALAPVKANARYGQCGGRDWTGSYACATGTTCQFQSKYLCTISGAPHPIPPESPPSNPISCRSANASTRKLLTLEKKDEWYSQCL